MLVARLASLAALVLCLAANSPSTGASPAPSPSPTPVSDPCGSILSIVNRPTVSTGVCTVRSGHFDVETGYTNTVTSGPGGGSNANYPQALLRFGTANPHVDLEIGAPSYETTSVGTPLTSGWSDLNLGMKAELGYSANADWGANIVVAFPTGSQAFTGGNAQFTGNLNGGYTINSELSLAGTLSFNAFSGINSGGVAQSYFAFVPSLELSAALPGGPSQVSAEYAYFSAAGPNLGPKSLIDFVYQRDFGPHLQFDVEYGFSPTVLNGQKQHYLGAGLSFMN
ncbi:MAG: hypothetical protein JO165_10420 [Candidatus Eremiobacteraeota bacterium]|nr:hypothetical protein [Candidatus Eremiobacteraeota bacterium]